MSENFKVVFLRHGESVWNVANIFTGWADVDLSPAGDLEAIAAGKCLKEKGFKFDVVFTSVLKRSIRTAWTACMHSDNYSMPIINSWRLNERHYGALQGLNKAETAAKHGDDQVKIWRRSYDIPPPEIDPADARHPSNDPMYKHVPVSALPGAESLALTVDRVLPFWFDNIAPVIMAGRSVMVAAHGNSLRALCKFLEGMSEAEVLELNIPTAVPLVYELDSKLRFVKKYYLMDEEEVKAKMAAVANQGKAAAPSAGPSMESLWPAYEAKMQAEGLNSAAIAAFKYNFGVLVSGQSTMIPESAIGPVESLPELDSLDVTPDPSLLASTVILKLNGGLGTGMGLDKAKSLLEVSDGNTFLDLIAKQIESMKASNSTDLKFMLMNSFSTSQDTLEALSKYPDLGTGDDLEFVQNKAPKVTKSDLTPATWPANPGHEWCPPGHGDLYPAMLGSGTLEKLLGAGFKYMFVSNSDNLGATMDLKLLTYFVSMKAPFMMEVAIRTDADKKGGHLAKDNKSGGLLLREVAQCPDEDEKAFQDVSKYKYFNTNNLWVDLVALKAIFEANNGSIPLPVMTNEKTVDPRDKKSTKVLQLETAMGAAIGCFEGATAVVIPRSRFAPVKTTNDLMALRSDAYMLTEDFRITLAPERNFVPPNVKLDGRYKFVDAMETIMPSGAPSLIGCKSLTVEGEVVFEADVVFKGTVVVKNGGEGPKTLAAGIYGDDSGEKITVEL
eukprot:CAMPEP_0203839164 /NCGR_PEP_ID=MMETSP0359-20131031/1_1 /ASSEMBLY_ACC=CAM_ASM_000338 /TAXON_ID=268821 /ORGANISM="Scrippsiella Hangoei, Strain SHTV-5" /LENGTH=726 /DNA_ID=CAMNT_0050753147 /DNA_START=59 /DNA_END=2239 /DNA_ORIENTATION=+